MIPYSAAYLLTVLLTLVGVAIDLTMASNEVLEIPRRGMAVLGIVSGVITAASVFLPSINSQGDTKREGWTITRRNIVRTKKG